MRKLGLYVLMLLILAEAATLLVMCPDALLR